jgi:hypothetical protein
MKWWKQLQALPAWRQVAYWIATVAAFALLVWDIVDEEAHYTTVLFFVAIIIGVVALRAPDRRA